MSFGLVATYRRSDDVITKVQTTELWSHGLDMSWTAVMGTTDGIGNFVDIEVTGEADVTIDWFIKRQILQQNPRPS